MSNDNLQRLKYSRGLLLTAKDFEDQQNYHREKLSRFIERFPHGIVRGVHVICSAPAPGDPDDSESFLIQEGLAIDADGNLIIVPDQGVRIKVTDFKQSSPYLGLKYEEEEICIRQGCESPATYNRIIEKVIPVWSTTPNTPGQDQTGSIITVAKIELKSSTTVDEDTLTAMAEEKKCTNHLILDNDDTGPVIRLDAGLITEDQIADNAISQDKIKDHAINQEKLADDIEATPKNDSVTADKIADGSVTTTHIQDAAITTLKLAGDIEATPKNDSVTADKIADGSVTTTHIQDAAVTTPKLADDIEATPKNDSVTADKIADGSVTTTHIQDAAITTLKLAGDIEATPKNDSVTADKIAEGSVTTAHIQDAAVTTLKLADGTEAIPKDESVTSDKIVNDSVTSAHIQDGAVLYEKIAFILEETGEEGFIIPYTAIVPIYGLHDIDSEADELLSFQVIPEDTGGPLFWMAGMERLASGAIKYHVKVINHGVLPVAYIVYKIKLGKILP